MDYFYIEQTLRWVAPVISVIALTLSWRSYHIARGSFVASNRSWLVVSNIEVINVSDRTSQFGVKIGNIGKSPAQYRLDVRLSGKSPASFPLDSVVCPSSSADLMTIAPNQDMVVDTWPDWEDRDVPPPRLYVTVIYRDSTIDLWRRSEAMYFIGSEVERTGVRSLVFDRGGNAKGAALLLNQRMT